MKKNEIIRCNFIKGTIGTGILLAGVKFLAGSSTFDSKEFPLQFLRKTE